MIDTAEVVVDVVGEITLLVAEVDTATSKFTKMKTRIERNSKNLGLKYPTRFSFFALLA